MGLFCYNRQPMLLEETPDYTDGIDYKGIAALYNYQPIPKGYERQKIALGIDWNAGRKERDAVIASAMSRFQYCLPLDASEKTLGEVVVPAEEGPLKLIITQPNTYFSTERKIKITLKRSSDQKVADYFLINSGDSRAWDMKHRIVHEEFEGQGIMRQMLTILEQCIGYLGEEIVIDASQLPLLNVLLRSGYGVFAGERGRFNDTMKALHQGDQKFMLASCMLDFFTPEAIERRKWYLFRRKQYEQSTDVWYGNHYIEESERFLLGKKMPPRTADVTEVQTEMAQKLHIAS